MINAVRRETILGSIYLTLSQDHHIISEGFSRMDHQLMIHNHNLYKICVWAFFHHPYREESDITIVGLIYIDAKCTY